VVVIIRLVNFLPIIVAGGPVLAAGFRQRRLIEVWRAVWVVRVRPLGVDRGIRGRVWHFQDVPALRTPAGAAGELVPHVEVGLAIGAGDGDRH
jgi:hypothetical protein